MKKLLIILGVIILLLAGAVWTYIFFYGVPESADEVFGRFTEAPENPAYVGTNDEGIVDIGEESDEMDEVTRERLYQLTTRPVAGAIFTQNGIRYVERGTGHVYEIALTGGSERLVSGTTHPRTIEADFSSDGGMVVLTSESGNGLTAVLGTLIEQGSDSRLEMTALPVGAREAAFSADGKTLNFFVPNASGGTGYAYTLETKVTNELFSIPLTDVRIHWGKPTYVYTTPSGSAMGYIYRLNGSSLEYVTGGGKGLMAYPYASGTIVTTVVDGTPSSYDPENGPIPVALMIPEKCSRALPSSQTIICAVPLNASDMRVFPDDWYKGVFSFSDAIVGIDGANALYTGYSRLEEESGRPIDVTALGVNPGGNMIHFINKYDGALWMLDLR